MTIRTPQQREIVQRLPPFFVMTRLTGILSSGRLRSIQTVIGNKIASWKGNCPPIYAIGIMKKYIPEIHSPEGVVFTKGWPELLERKPGILALFLCLLEPMRIVHRNICFIGRPPHTQPNLPVDIPRGSRWYQGFSTIPIPRVAVVGDKIAQLTFLHGFLLMCSPSF